MVAGPCKSARTAQDCQEEKNSRCQTDSTKRVNINITPLINIAVEGRILAGYALLPAARTEPYDHGTRYSAEFSTYNVFSI